MIYSVNQASEFAPGDSNHEIAVSSQPVYHCRRPASGRRYSQSAKDRPTTGRADELLLPWTLIFVSLPRPLLQWSGVAKWSLALLLEGPPALTVPERDPRKGFALRYGVSWRWWIIGRASGDDHSRRMVGHYCSHNMRIDRQDFP
jgi:hypothetical protein